MGAAKQLPDGTWDYGGGKVYTPGQGFNTPAAAAPGGPSAIDFSSYAQDDPRMVQAYNQAPQEDPRMVAAYGQQQDAYKTLQGRMGADNSKRAIDHAVLGTMDAAALGAKDLGANMARRGISGSGTGATFLQKNVFAPASREAANQATNISLAEQQRQDDLARSLQGAAGGLQNAAGGIASQSLQGWNSRNQVAGNISGQNLNNRQFGLSAWQAQQQEAIQRAQLEQQAREAEISRWMALAMSGAGSPAAAPGAPPIPTGPSSPYGSVGGAATGGGFMGAYR